MKKIIVFVLLIVGTGILTGCSTERLQEQYQMLMSYLVERDAEHEQGFADLTREQVYEKFHTKNKLIDLSTMNLSKIPDLCELMDEDDHLEVWHITLANNNIKLVDVDLGCFKFLQTLNLSYNSIQTIVSVGDLPMLKELSLKKNDLEDTDGLPELPSLETLNIGYNNLKSVANLEQYPLLKELQLQHNVIEEIFGVETLEKLEKVKLESNKLKDLSFLDGLENLILVTAKGNEVAENLLDKWNQLNEIYVQKRNAEAASGSEQE